MRGRRWLPGFADGSHCNGSSDADPEGEVDLDADGFLSCEECDDSDVAVFPGAPERCNGLDDDCNGIADYLPDGEADLDGDGAPACDDCDDTTSSVFPAAPEVCDGFDNDCDSAVDESSLRVPDQWPTIQAALDVAVDADVVCVAPGTYFENIDYGGTSAHVLGWGGPNLTVIDGGGLDSVVRIDSGEGPGTILEGFTIANGVGTGTDGGGVEVEDAEAALVDLIVTGNTGIQYGTGGVSVLNGSLDLLGVHIAENSSVVTGGLNAAFSVINAQWLTLEGNQGSIGGAAISAYSTAIIENLLVLNNDGVSTPGSGGTGGMLVGTGTVASITNGRFEGNSSSQWGGGIVLDSSVLSVANASFVSNLAGERGGVVYSVLSSMLVSHSTFVANEAPRGAVAYGVGGDFEFVGCDLSFNTASINGGAWTGLSTVQSTFAASWSNFYDNTIFPFGTFPSPVGTNGNTSLNPMPVT